MSPLLITLLGVLLVPLLVGTWRTSLLGLACQGFLMAWIAYRLSPELDTASAWVTLCDLVVLRGVAAPAVLYRVLRSQNAPKRNDVIPPNLLSWTVAFGIILVAFNLSGSLVPGRGEQQTLVAVAAAGVLLGFLVLSTQSGPFSQMVGALRIENAIALFELGGARDRAPLGIHLGQIAVVAGTVALYRWYLETLGAGADATPESALEEPTL
jgi:hydrogenase-4 component E